MKKLKFYWVFIHRFFTRYSTVLLSLVVVALVVFFIVLKILSSVSVPVVVEGMVGTYTPDSLPPTVTNLLSQGLVAIDKTGKPYPDLATWQTNSDVKEYTFTLKDNLTWSDGTKVSAEDIALAVPEASTSAIDNKTLRFDLNDSYSAFPTLLDKPIFKNGTSIGVGPYSIDKITLDPLTGVFIEQISLHALTDGLPDVVIKFYPGDDVAKEALQNGDVSSIIGIDNVSQFQNQPPFTILGKTNYARIITIFYNTADKVLSDRNFRLALSFAAPEIKGQATAITSLSPNSWAFNPDVRNYLDNPDQEKLYIGKVKDVQNDTITLTATTSLANVGQQVVSEWNRMGIKATLRVESGIPQNFQALLTPEDIPLDPDQYFLWHSTQSETNISKISSPRIDQDLEDGRKTSDSATRLAKYQDFQKVLLDESPATFLYFPVFNVVTLKKDQTSLEKVLKLQYPNLGF